jgi:hypothetical protein
VEISLSQQLTAVLEGVLVQAAVAELRLPILTSDPAVLVQQVLMGTVVKVEAHMEAPVVLQEVDYMLTELMGPHMQMHNLVE